MNTAISDASFSNLDGNTARWIAKTHAGVTIVPTVDDATIRLDISNTSGANWHGELCYAPFSVAVGSRIDVSFAARARRPFSFSVWLGQSESPYESLVAPENHFGDQEMTSEWQTYTHRWQPTVGEPAARLVFVLGQIDNHVELKSIRLATAA